MASCIQRIGTTRTNAAAISSTAYYTKTIPDRLIWKQGQNVYTPGLGYLVLEDQNTRNSHWQALWKQKVPPEVKIFIWQAIHNVLPTLEFYTKGVFYRKAYANGACMEAKI